MDWVITATLLWSGKIHDFVTNYIQNFSMNMKFLMHLRSCRICPQICQETEQRSFSLKMNDEMSSWLVTV